MSEEEQELDPPLQEVLELMIGWNGLLERVRPREARLSYTQQQIAWLFASCEGSFAGVFVLLKEGLVSEARTLHRTMFEDTVKLRYFETKQADVDELALRLVYTSLSLEIGLEEFAQEHGVPRGNTLELRRGDLWETFQLAHDLGLNKLKQLPDMRGMLAAIGLEGLYFGFKLGSHFTHSSRLSFATRLTERSTDTYRVSILGSTRDLVSDGLTYVETFSAATLSFFNLMEWDTRHEILTERRALFDKTMNIRNRLGMRAWTA